MQHYIIKLNVASSSAKHRWQELWDQHFPHVFLQPRRILKERAQKFLILWHPPIFTLPLSSHLFPQQLPQVALHTFWTHLLFLHFPFFHWFLHLALPNLFLQTVCAPVWYKTYSPPISKLKRIYKYMYTETWLFSPCCLICFPKSTSVSFWSCNSSGNVSQSISVSSRRSNSSADVSTNLKRISIIRTCLITHP